MSNSNSTPPTLLSSLPKSLRSTLSSLCSDYRDLQEQISVLEAAKKSLMAQIRPLAQEHGLEKVKGEGWTLNRTGRTTTSISPEKLLSRGVKLEVIEFATETKTTEFFTVTK